jgi:hypothetical protein
MAGQPHRGTRGRARSPRRASSAPLDARLSGAGRGHASTALPTTATSPAGPPPPSAADQLITRSTYHLLLLKGLSPGEAANLTAFLCGIPIAEVHWSLRQVNQLLFLREMARTGRFGPRDGEPARPH